MIDHVEVIVPDRAEAARWYEQALGLKPVDAYAHWAEDPRGPLMISADGGATKIALFQGKVTGDEGGWHRLAFRRDAQGWLAFVDGAAELGVTTERGALLSRDDAVDHGEAFSVYFRDPWGHRLEVTSYDHNDIRRALDRD